MDVRFLIGTTSTKKSAWEKRKEKSVSEEVKLSVLDSEILNSLYGVLRSSAEMRTKLFYLAFFTKDYKWAKKSSGYIYKEYLSRFDVDMEALDRVYTSRFELTDVVSSFYGKKKVDKDILIRVFAKAVSQRPKLMRIFDGVLTTTEKECLKKHITLMR